MKRCEKLALLRKEKGLTQMELAAELDISRQAVSRWETGASVPTTENLACLSRLYQVPMDYLLDEGAERTVREGSVPKEEMEARPDPARRKGERMRAVLGTVVLVLLALVLGLCSGYFIGKADQDDGEIHLFIEEMEGEEVDISSAGHFTIETGW